MRPVNLIPPEERRGDRAPLRAGPLAYVVVGILLVAFIGVYMLVSTGNAISEREAEVASLEQSVSSTSARAEALQSFANFASLEQARTQTVADLARSRFDWERVLRELALVIPADVSLGSLAGSVTEAAATGGQSADAAGIDAPSLAMSGCGKSHESVARFVAALRDIDGVTRVGLSNSSEGGASSAAGATTSTPAAGGAPTGGAGCDPGDASFELTVVFDDVQVDPASGGILPPEEPAPAAGDGSGVAEAEQARGDAVDSVESADENANQAVERYVPGA